MFYFMPISDHCAGPEWYYDFLLDASLHNTKLFKQKIYITDIDAEEVSSLDRIFLHKGYGVEVPYLKSTINTLLGGRDIEFRLEVTCL